MPQIDDNCVRLHVVTEDSVKFAVVWDRMSCNLVSEESPTLSLRQQIASTDL
jgi:hypothetical protein